MAFPDADPDFPWSVAQFDLGLRNKRTGRFELDGTATKGGFLVLPATDEPFEAKLESEAAASLVSYGAVFDYAKPPLRIRAATTTVWSHARFAQAAPKRRKTIKRVARSVVLEGVVPYKWDSDEDYPQFLGQPVYANKHGMTATATESAGSVLVALFYGFIENSTEVQLLLIA